MLYFSRPVSKPVLLVSVSVPIPSCLGLGLGLGLVEVSMFVVVSGRDLKKYEYKMEKIDTASSVAYWFSQRSGIEWDSLLCGKIATYSLFFNSFDILRIAFRYKCAKCSPCLLHLLLLKGFSMRGLSKGHSEQNYGRTLCLCSCF